MNYVKMWKIYISDIGTPWPNQDVDVENLPVKLHNTYNYRGVIFFIGQIYELELVWKLTKLIHDAGNSWIIIMFIRQFVFRLIWKFQKADNIEPIPVFAVENIL